MGVTETAYLYDDIDVETIADGCHLPIDLIKMIMKIKGADKIMLVSDDMPITGLDVTEGELTGISYIVEDGVCKLVDRSAFAGSIATADRLVRVAVREAGIPLTDAVKMMTEIPARIMGLDNKGRLAPDTDADIVAFDDGINIKNVFVGGILAK